MTKQLDDKLQNTLYSFASGVNQRVRTDKELLKSAIAQIKQAFADEGYISFKKEYEVKGFLTKQQWERQAQKDGWKRPEAETINLTFDNGKPERLMTGQEWYDRFEKELYKPKPQEYPMNKNDDGESHDRFFRAGGTNFMYRKAIEAAKRAAGLSNE